MKKLLCVLVVLGVTAIAAAPAQAAKYKVNSTVVIANIGMTGSPPVSGSVDYAGSVKGSQGSGAILGHNDFGPTVGQFQGTNKVFYNKGTLKTTLEGTGGPNTGPEGGLIFSGAGEFTKGTGKYKGAKGKFTFEGTEPANSTVTTFTVTGSLKY
jgi:hypothetical protein